MLPPPPTQEEIRAINDDAYQRIESLFCARQRGAAVRILFCPRPEQAPMTWRLLQTYEFGSPGVRKPLSARVVRIATIKEFPKLNLFAPSFQALCEKAYQLPADAPFEALLLIINEVAPTVLLQQPIRFTARTALRTPQGQRIPFASIELISPNDKPRGALLVPAFS